MLILVNAILILFSGHVNLCSGDVPTGMENSSPIIEDFYFSSDDSLFYTKATCPCYCTIEENQIFVFKTKLDGAIEKGWLFDGATDLSTSRKGEIVVIEKLPPNDNGTDNHQVSKTIYKIQGEKVWSKNDTAQWLSTPEIEKWQPDLKSFAAESKLNRIHLISLAAFNRNDVQSAITILFPLEKEIEENRKTEILNDLGFFLEEANRPAEAIPVLEKVVAFDPSRTPAYLNLGDAYLKSGDRTKAKANYAKYVDLMEKSEKGSKVPARVHEFLKN